MRVWYTGGPLDGKELQEDIARLQPWREALWPHDPVPIDQPYPTSIPLRIARYQAHHWSDGSMEYRYVPGRDVEGSV